MVTFLSRKWSYVFCFLFIDYDFYRLYNYVNRKRAKMEPCATPVHLTLRISINNFEFLCSFFPIWLQKHCQAMEHQSLWPTKSDDFLESWKKSRYHWPNVYISFLHTKSGIAIKVTSRNEMGWMSVLAQCQWHLSLRRKLS